MKKIVIVLSTALILVSCGDTDISKRFSAGFRYICLSEYDENHDKKLSLEEAANVEKLIIDSDSDFQKSYLSDYFTSVKTVEIRGVDKFDVDFSDIQTIESVKCNNTAVENINVSGCGSLKQIRLPSRLKSLDVSGCVALEALNVSKTELISLDVSTCSALKDLSCNICNLSSLIIGDNPVLQKISCRKNNLTSIVIGDCPSLKEFDCGENELDRIDLKKCPSLIKLCCRENKLANLDLSACSLLEWLECSENPLSELDLSRSPHINYLEAQCNSMATIYLSDQQMKNGIGSYWKDPMTVFKVKR